MTDPHLLCMFSSQRTFDVVSYFDGIFFLSLNGEESLNKFLSSDPDPNPGHLRAGLSHQHNTSWVKKSSQSEKQFLRYASGQTYRQTETNA